MTEENISSSSSGQQDRFVKTTAKQTMPATRPLPVWKVLLHNDDENVIDDVVTTILMLTPLREYDAVQRTLEAHQKGVSLLLTTHQERAELYACQFASCNLSVTIEPE